MQQPKFKFGDKLTYSNGQTGTELEVQEIKYLRTCDGFKYCYNGGFYEDEVGLYQEPRKRKLYAYRKPVPFFTTQGKGNGHEIRMLTDVDLARVEIGLNWWERAPEYDIEYPDA